MLNTGGAKSSRRRLLASVTQSIMLYGAPVWAKHMGCKGWTEMGKSNRKIGIKVIAAYRTVSKSAVEVLSGMPPPDLVAEYRSSMKTTEGRVEAEDKMIQAWQSRWEQADIGRWTHRLIPNIKRWHKRTSGIVEYHLTQALTGHECFSAYLHRFGKLPSPECMFCGYHTDDAHHTLFKYDAWYGR
jgi:RNA binding protein fox-1